jgi:hypothetical protein
MTNEQEQARLLAERIARRVSQSRSDVAARPERSRNDLGAELSAMRASIDDLRHKLVQIESRLTHDEGDAIRPSRVDEQAGSRRHAAIASTSSSTRAPYLSGMYVPAGHPSQERFGVEEATISELVDFFEGEKKCELEPGGKPCDHCSMCSSRGF